MKLFVQVVDTLTGISQNGMIEEPVKNGFEIQNALKHFGISEQDVEWLCPEEGFSEDINGDILSGRVEGTYKLLSIICVGKENTK